MGFWARLFGDETGEPKPRAISSREPDDTEVVLAILHPKFHGNNEVGVVVGAHDAHTIASDRAKIAEYREWLKTQPPRVVRAYEYWLTFYEKGCNEAERAIKNGARQKFHDKWEQDVSSKLRKAEAAARSFPQPR